MPLIYKGPLEGLVPSIQHIEKGEKRHMDQTQLLAHCGSNKITREELRMVPTPEGTESHHPLAHHLIREGLDDEVVGKRMMALRAFRRRNHSQLFPSDFVAAAVGKQLGLVHMSFFSFFNVLDRRDKPFQRPLVYKGHLER